MEPIRVVQLSDLHFSTKPGGYMLRDTAETFAAVADQVRAEAPDLVVVTGDIANDGKADEYELAATGLAGLGLPVHCLPGNHDFVDPLHAVLPGPGVSVQRSLRLGPWLFLFGDSNRDGGVHDPNDGWVDHADRVDLARGGLTPQEQAWLRRQLDTGEADHAMVWLHHPPGGAGMFANPSFDEEVAALAGTTTPIRAIAAGHEHTGVNRAVAGIPSHVCPSTGVCVDFEALRLMPPGYRRFAFHADGRIDTEVVWLDDERWNDRWELPEWVAEYFAGLMTDEQMKARLAEGR